MRSSDGRPVLLEVLRPVAPSPRELARMDRELAVAGKLDTSAVVRPVARETWAGMPALVFEDFGGDPIRPAAGEGWEVGRFLRVAVRAAAAFCEIHGRDVVHKGLEPQHILLHPLTGEVRISGFGLASFGGADVDTLASPARIEGSLAYMAPEQTRRTRGQIDARSDLYALGACFYELLAGRRLFEASDLAGWVHAHVAQPPPPLEVVAPHVPAGLAAVVMRLLAKSPEGRYQSASGLHHDLQRALAAWEARGDVPLFPLGERDASERLQVPQRLHGRQREVAALLESFERVARERTPELVLVSGYSGIGKTSLVRELQAPVVAARGFFAAGKFDQLSRGVPHATLGQALTNLLVQLLGAPGPVLEEWRARLRTTLGPAARVIAEVAPMLQAVTGDLPPLPELPPAEAQNRFRLALARFLDTIARGDQPLVLFFDDLQWADASSLGAMMQLVTTPALGPLLLIGAYRDNEVGPSHPLQIAVSAARRDGARVRDIVLGPLAPEDTAEMLREMLSRRIEAVSALSRLVHEKTGGNPFFAIHLLRELERDRLLCFDRRAAVWRWEPRDLESRSYSDNVVELMVSKLQRLPRATREVLEVAACVGSRGELETLSVASDVPLPELRDRFDPSEREGLLAVREGTYAFAHDRVQQAALAMVPESRRPQLHLRIGRLLLAKTSPEGLAERPFEVVDQLTLGLPLLTDRPERERLAELSALAGARAKASVAYGRARGYFATAAALLAEIDRGMPSRRCWEAELSLAECEYLAGNFEAADARFAELTRSAASELERARAELIRLRLRVVSGRYAEGVDEALEALALFGVRFPASGEELATVTEMEVRAVEQTLAGLDIQALAVAPVASDPRIVAAIDLLTEMVPCAYVARSEIFPLLVARAVNLALTHGNTASASFAYSGYALMAVSTLQATETAYALSQMSLELDQTLGGGKRRGMLLHVLGDHVNFWKRPFATGLPILEEAFVACLEAGDLVYSSGVAFQAPWHVFESGARLEDVHRFSQRFAEYARSIGNQPALETIHLQQRFWRALQSSDDPERPFDGDGFEEASFLELMERSTFGCGMAFHRILKLMLLQLFGRPREALAAASEPERWLGAAMAMPIEATYFFHRGLAAAAALRTEDDDALHTILRDALARFSRWAAHCPENFEARRALLEAELARTAGDELSAQLLYERAIAAAREHGLAHHEALTWELAGEYWRSRGFETVAQTYLSTARSTWLRWGAAAKARDLEGRLRLIRAWSGADGRPEDGGLSSLPADQLDIVSLVKASQTVSTAIVYDEVVRVLLTVALEEGSARRGHLLRVHGDGAEVVAAAEAAGGEVKVTLHPPRGAEDRVPMSLVNLARRTRRPVVLEDAARELAVERTVGLQPTRSLLCLPVLRKGEVVAVLHLENDLAPGAFTPASLAALDLVAAQAAISFDNALLLERELAARTRAERAEERAAFLAEATALLTESLELDVVLSRLADLVVRTVGEWCFIDLLAEDGELQRVVAVHVDPAKAELAREVQRCYPPRRDSAHPASKVVRSGVPMIVEAPSDAELRATAVDERHMELIRALGVRTGLCVPLQVRGRIAGALSVGTAAPEGAPASEALELTEEIARRAAIAIENAQLYQASREATRAREEFLSVASHELRTPLAALDLCAQMLRRYADVPASRERALTRIVRQSKRMQRLVDELLSVSRVQMGRLELALDEIDLAEVVAGVEEDVREELQEAGCTLVVGGDRSVVGRWDRSRLEQVLINLLSNAMKFAAGKPIEIELVQRGGVARLSVRDRGIGIPPDRLARVFDRFERAVSARAYGGLGLGLFIVRSIVEAHGGTVRAESEEGRGTCVTVELPLAPPAAEGSPAPSEDRPGRVADP